ncbi:hypothetical protein [Achromobacter xylosoxidans]|uniref:hypothetical protein n=1 Tax=Alcaligenes xylosoxydans xylosoxydans TaxID=85698 RepID=UPI0022B87D37|nr:hypothetical protein [Achromobacter xylosoxidans]MCZ8393829.1 hypothetical protein [Achromobacter xylosoxidans]
MITRTQERRTNRGVARAWAALAAIACCLLPLPALALGPGCQLDPTVSGNYTQDLGASYALGQLAPRQITLDNNNPPGTVVYDEPLPPVPYVCIATSLATAPFLNAGTGLTTVLKELRRAGLKLVINIAGLPPWEPTGNTTDDRFRLTNVAYAPKSPTDPTPTVKGVLFGRMQLVVVTPPSIPIHAYFAASKDLVRLNPAFIGANYVAIGSTNDTSVDLLPRCIAKISTPASVSLGRAYAVNSLPLPAPVEFTMYADFDETCDGGFRVVDLGSLDVPLKIMFQPTDNLELDALNQGIVLKGDDGQPNGLNLVLKKDKVYRVTFNTWENTQTLSTSRRPVPLVYSAQLSKSGGPLKVGPFSQKVTVLVTYQ